MGSVDRIPNIREITSFRGDPLTIDLGKVFQGTLEARMSKNNDTSGITRDFAIQENRYISLSRELTSDYLDEDLNAIQLIQGKWKFQVTSEGTTIYQGTIIFVNGSFESFEIN